MVAYHPMDKEGDDQRDVSVQVGLASVVMRVGPSMVEQTDSDVFDIGKDMDYGDVSCSDRSNGDEVFGRVGMDGLEALGEPDRHAPRMSAMTTHSRAVSSSTTMVLAEAASSRTSVVSMTWLLALPTV